MEDETGKEGTTHGGSGVRNADIVSENITERDHFGKRRRIWEYIIKTVPTEIGPVGMDWIHLADDSIKLSFSNEAIIKRIIVQGVASVIK
jgi:hypothetical protein